MFKFITTKKTQEGKERQNYIDALKEWHLKRDQEQIQLEAAFEYSSIEYYPINIWDEIAPDNTTYLYIENEDIPNKIQLEVLLHIMAFTKTPALQSQNCKFELVFWDDSIMHPELIDGEYSSTGAKAWTLKISDVEYDTLEVLVNIFEKIPELNGKPLRVYSES